MIRGFPAARIWRRKRRDERIVKAVAAFEIVERIALGFSKDADANQIKNHLADVLAAMNAPIRKNRRHHRPELFERELPHAVEQFLAPNVPRSLLLVLLFQLDRKI